MVFKVISDNGYKIELIRPLRDGCMEPGTAVDLTVKKGNRDLVELFDNIINDDTRKLLMDAKVKIDAKVRTAKKESK